MSFLITLSFEGWTNIIPDEQMFDILCQTSSCQISWLLLNILFLIRDRRASHAYSLKRNSNLPEKQEKGENISNIHGLHIYSLKG